MAPYCLENKENQQPGGIFRLSGPADLLAPRATPSKKSESIISNNFRPYNAFF